MALLTDNQIAALERKKLDDEACGEIETHHAGYLGSQDPFYVGNLKGVGRWKHCLMENGFGRRKI